MQLLYFELLAFVIHVIDGNSKILVVTYFFLEVGRLGKEKCSHGEVEFLGTEKGEKGVNRYYKCSKCGSVLVLSEDEGVLYEVPSRP